MERKGEIERRRDGEEMEREERDKERGVTNRGELCLPGGNG